MPQVPKYWRSEHLTGRLDEEGKVIKDFTTVHKSINEAKRYSRELQKGVIEQGSLIVRRTKRKAKANG